MRYQPEFMYTPPDAAARLMLFLYISPRYRRVSPLTAYRLYFSRAYLLCVYTTGAGSRGGLD